MKVPVYLDIHSTTPCAEEVVDIMIPYFRERYGNAASRTHRFGFEAKAAVELARERVSALISASPKEIIWTSGATESNNLAILGAAREASGAGKHIVISAIEHKSVIDAAAHLQSEGWSVTQVCPGADGVVQVEAIEAAMTSQTTLVSLMMANNEVGTVQPVRDVGLLCRDKGVIFHVDAAQASGKLQIHVKESCIDLLSLSAHKMYGPKGIGALYVRRGRPRFRLQPILFGGGHERGLRSGTLPVPLIAGMGRAATLALEDMDNDVPEKMAALRDQLWSGLQRGISGICLNGSADTRLPNNLNVSISDVESQALMMSIRDLAISSGSACSSASLEPSYVLGAMGVDPALAHASIRFGLSRYTTSEEVEYATQRLTEAVRELRAMSPIYSVNSDP